MNVKISAFLLIFVTITVTAIVFAGPSWRKAKIDIETETRPIAWITTDKMVYREGESVFIRIVALDGMTFRPIADGTVTPRVTVLGPKGEILAQFVTNFAMSTAGVRWDVPAGSPGGPYTARVEFPWNGNPPAERDFEVRAYRAPRLKTDVVFAREGYGPGDTVSGSLNVKRSEGGIPAGANVQVLARIDGIEVFRGQSQVTSTGDAPFEFGLPTEIEKGDGTVSLVITDGGVVETATKTLPILLSTLELSIYPEGGELVANVPNGVYVEARTPWGKPADISGMIVDSAGVETARIRTEHEGRGRTSFTPRPGESYSLVVQQPSGIRTPFKLPVVQSDGVAISAPDGVAVFDGAITITLASPNGGNYIAILSKRDIELTSESVQLDGGIPATIELKPDRHIGGTLTVTIWTAEGKPVAERLIFRNPEQRLSIAIVPNKQSTIPGDQVSLDLKVTDESGKPVQAVIGLSITDESIQSLIEKRDRVGQLPTLVFLEPDVVELKDPDVYFEAGNSNARSFLDLLLGTQGWRRFAVVNTDVFVQQNGDRGRRAMAHVLPPAPASSGGVARGGFPAGIAVAEDAVEMAPPPVAAPVDVAGAVPVPDVVDLPKPEEARAEVIVDIPEQPRASSVAKPAAEPRVQAALSRGDFLEKAKMHAKEEMDDDWHHQGGEWITVREFAHRVRDERQPGNRVDFAETLYWNAGIQTTQDGTARVEFGTSDAVTSFVVNADAFDNRGALGASRINIESVEPFFVEPKLPLEITQGDTISIPIALVNGTSTDFSSVSLDISPSKGVESTKLDPVTLAAGQRTRTLLHLTATDPGSDTTITIDAKATPYADRITKTLKIVPRGFPVEDGLGGMLSAAKPFVFDVEIPKTVVKGSQTSKLVLYASPLANLTEALERLIQEPYGCFEQTSSTTYPLVMAQTYFTTHAGVPSSTIQRSRDLLDAGYKRLKGFQTKDRGYEWFGEDPGHEALSAFGLMEFSDMAAVYPVDPTMLEEVRKFMLTTRDGKGGFVRARRALHTWLADESVSNSYICWAMLEAKVPASELKEEIAWVVDAGQTTNNSYVTALAANVASLAGMDDAAKSFRKKLASQQSKEGNVTGATMSVVGSEGESLQIETTALATLAWLRSKEQVMEVEKAIQWLTEVCKGGRYGSTQSTVLALRAILEYDRQRSKERVPGTVQVKVDGYSMGGPVPFGPDSDGAVVLADIAEMLEAGKHRIELVMSGGSELPVAAAIGYNTLTPSSSPDCAVDLNVRLLKTMLVEGETNEVEVTVKNRRSETVPTPVAIVGLPGNLEPRHEQLKELVKSNKIAAYEVRGREVVLYWRAFQPNEITTLLLQIEAAIPGKTTGPASRAYLYYGDEYKTWRDGLVVEVAAK